MISLRYTSDSCIFLTRQISLSSRLATISYFFMLMCLLLPHLYALDADDISDDLPRKFYGVYEWEGTKEPKQMTILEIEEVQKLGNGKVEFRGKHGYHYMAHAGTRIKGTIDPQTLHVSMKEYQPTDAKFITQGTFEGTISKDLTEIVASWIPKGEGRRGSLRLHEQQSREFVEVANDPGRAYDNRLFSRITEHWRRQFTDRTDKKMGGKLKISFDLLANGQIKNCRVLEADAGLKRDSIDKSLSSLKQAQPFESFSEELKKKWGESRKIMVTFEFTP